MKSKILKTAGIILLIPLLTIISFSLVWSSRSMRIFALAAGTLLETAFIILSKKEMGAFFKPHLGILNSMGIKRVPTPYEPGKFNRDFKFTGIGIYMSSLSPAVAYAAKINTKTITVSGISAISFTAPDFDLLITSFALVLSGALCMAIWAKLGQAVIITNELGEKNRYLYMGFAEEADDKNTFFSYRMLSKEK